MIDQFEQGKLPTPEIIKRQINETIDKTKTFLEEGMFESKEERDLYLRELYGLLAASNDDEVRELIHDIESRYPERE